MSGLQLWSENCEKQVGYRVQTVLDDPYLFSAYQKFGAEVLRRSSVFHGLGEFLRRERIRGGVCFEVGTWHALTSVILSRHFEQVVTVDIFHNPIKHEILDHLGIKNVKCVDIKDNEQKKEVVKDIRFDFAYLDGNHADDTDLDWGLTKQCGRVLFHEAWPWQSDVWELVHKLPPQQVTHNGMGLALWDGRK